MPDPRSRLLPLSSAERGEALAFACVAGSAASVLVSIVAAQIFLGVALVAAVAAHPGGPARLLRLPFVPPLAVFFIWTVLAALASSDIPLGLTIVKKFYLFLMLFLPPLLLRREGRLLGAWRAIFLVACISAAAGLVQFALEPGRDLLHRISGFVSHWMTYSGLLMLVLVALSAWVTVRGLGKKGWTVAVGALLAAAIILSLTRNAWLGSVAGLTVILLLRKPRALLPLAGILLLLIVTSPAGLRGRLAAGFDPQDPNTRNRIEIFGTALRLIRDNPWFGVGPKNVSTEGLRYRGTHEFEDWMYQHMHNNFLQIAAERGLPGLVCWLWLMGRLAWDAGSLLRRASRRARDGPAAPDAGEPLFAAMAALGCWAALLVAGLAEYNFGDSEVLVLFLFVMSSPYAFLESGTERAEAG